MQAQAMTISDSQDLDNLFEDLHWTLLIAGHTLCMESEGETPLIPSEIMQHSIDQHSKNKTSQIATLKTLASVSQLTLDSENFELCDQAMRIFSDVLVLCAIEKSAAEVKLGHFLSPEVSCTLMWFLKRWCLSYLLPNEVLYQEVKLAS